MAWHTNGVNPRQITLADSFSSVHPSKIRQYTNHLNCHCLKQLDYVSELVYWNRLQKTSHMWMWILFFTRCDVMGELLHYARTEKCFDFFKTCALHSLQQIFNNNNFYSRYPLHWRKIFNISCEKYLPQCIHQEYSCIKQFIYFFKLLWRIKVNTISLVERATVSVITTRCFPEFVDKIISTI